MLRLVLFILALFFNNTISAEVISHEGRKKPKANHPHDYDIESLRPEYDVPPDIPGLKWIVSGKRGNGGDGNTAPLYGFDLMGKRFDKGTMPFGTAVKIEKIKTYAGMNYYGVIAGDVSLPSQGATQNEIEKYLSNLKWIKGSFLEPRL